VAERSTPRPRRSGGFALSELVLVLVVVGGLLLVAYTSTRNIRRETATSDCQTELRSLKLATEQFHAQSDTYPDDTRTLESAKLLKADEVKLWTVSFTAGDEGPTYTAVGITCAKIKP